jgi:hypothetical protein
VATPQAAPAAAGWSIPAARATRVIGTRSRSSCGTPVRRSAEFARSRWGPHRGCHSHSAQSGRRSLHSPPSCTHR